MSAAAETLIRDLSARRSPVLKRRPPARRSAGRNTDLRRRGEEVPAGETAPALCHHCGPVWLRPDVVAVTLKIDGWSRVLAHGADSRSRICRFLGRRGVNARAR